MDGWTFILRQIFVYNSIIDVLYGRINLFLSIESFGGRRSPAVACWASDHWVAGSNPLRGKFRH